MPLRRALPFAAILAACADPPPAVPPQAPVAIASAAPPAPSASAAPIMSATASPDAPKKRPPPVACPPRPGYAPVGYVHARGEKRGPHGSSDFGGPRFTTDDAELASSLGDVQGAIDQWLDRHSNAALHCKDRCWVSAYCEVTRNDGELLSLLCTDEFDFAEWRSGVERQAFLFRREGKRFVPITAQSLARKPDASLLLRLLAGHDVDDDAPVDDEKDVGPFYLALHDEDFEAGATMPFDPTPPMFRPYADVAHHLACDTLLDLPSGPPATPPAETGALAVATHVVEEDDPATAHYWFGSATSLSYPRFVALDPRQATAARTLNDAVRDLLDKLHARTKAEAWGDVEVYCRAYTSTSKLVSVMCHGGGHDRDGNSRVARGSINLRLTDPPQRITAAELFASKPNAPQAIAKRCLGHLVHKPADKSDQVLKALPRLTASDLGDFGLWQGGVIFAVEYDLAERRRLKPCYVPNEVLGTSLEMLTLPPKKR